MDAQQNQFSQDMEKLKEIPKWTRRYAQNRTLTALAIMVMCCLFSMCFTAFVVFPLALTVTAFGKGKMILGCVGIAVLVAGLAAIVKFYIIIFRKFGGKNKGSLDQIMDCKIYGKEGFATMPQPQLSKKMKVLDAVIGFAFMVLLIGTMNLAMSGYISIEHHLPIMALFVVPFGIYQYFTMKPRFGPLFLLFPIFFAIHALLVLAGLPLFFTGNFGVPFNIFLTLIYNLLAFIIAHLYSRYALKKLKGISLLEGDTTNEV
jgi:hypothetical protein